MSDDGSGVRDADGGWVSDANGDADPADRTDAGVGTDHDHDGVHADGGESVRCADERADSTAEFDPVEVFPDAESMDLRSGADDCYKCSTCDVNCPVAAVDDEFPGPKFQGPEQWRLTRRADADVDPSIMDCSNCMRCDSACPSDVPLSQMHNTARGAYVENQQRRFSRTYVRNRLLANYGLVARIASRVPRLANAVLGNRVTRWLNERLLGITSERQFPEFATETFREWYADRGGAAASRRNARAARRRRAGESVASTEGDEDATERTESANEADADDGIEADEKLVAYFHGCYANYNTPEVAKALVRVFEHFGYAVVVPDQRCSGTPMFANGMLDDARRAAGVTVDAFAAAIEDGADVVTSCTSCSLSLRQEYPELFDRPGTETVAEHTWEALEYLRVHEDLEGALANTEVDLPKLAYHAPCHARNQGLDGQALELLESVDGVEAEDVGDSCSGISGTYGWKANHYETSMAIGREMFEELAASDAATGLTECPTCAMQMEHGTGYEIRHPLEVLEAALIDERGNG